MIIRAVNSFVSGLKIAFFKLSLAKYHCFRSGHSEVFFRKVVLKICSKFTGEHPCWSAISIKLHSNFIEITLWHGCSLINLLHILRTPFLKKHLWMAASTACIKNRVYNNFDLLSCLQLLPNVFTDLYIL